MTRTSYFASTELGLLRFWVIRIILLHITFKHGFQILYQSIIAIFFSSPFQPTFFSYKKKARLCSYNAACVFAFSAFEGLERSSQFLIWRRPSEYRTFRFLQPVKTTRRKRKFAK